MFNVNNLITKKTQILIEVLFWFYDLRKYSTSTHNLGWVRIVRKYSKYVIRLIGILRD